MVVSLGCLQIRAIVSFLLAYLIYVWNTLLRNLDFAFLPSFDVQYLISVVLVMALQDFYSILLFCFGVQRWQFFERRRKIIDHLLYVNIIARANRIVVFVLVDFSVFTRMHNYTWSHYWCIIEACCVFDCFELIFTQDLIRNWLAINPTCNIAWINWFTQSYTKPCGTNKCQ